MWYILNYIPPGSKARNALPKLIQRFSASHPGAGLELFAPTFFKVVSDEKGPKRVERPLLYHYIFVKGEIELIKKLCFTCDGFSFVIDHAGPGRHLTVDDTTMDAFKTVARLQGNRLECFSPNEVDLQEGDKVQIVTGEFAGLTGTYLPRKGGRSGNIYVAVTQNLGTVVYDINPDSLRVIEFAPATRRPYDQMDAYIPRLLSLLLSTFPRPVKNPSDTPSPVAGGTPSIAAAIIFTRRFSSVKIGNPKVDAKLQLMLYASYRIIGDIAEAAKTLKRYRNLACNITNVWTRALSHLIFGLLNSDQEQLRKGRELISSSTNLSSIQTTIASALTA